MCSAIKRLGFLLSNRRDGGGGLSLRNGCALFFRSDAARSGSATFWLSSGRAGHALCCHSFGKQVRRIPSSCLCLETKHEMKLFLLQGDWGNLRKSKQNGSHAFGALYTGK